MARHHLVLHAATPAVAAAAACGKLGAVAAAFLAVCALALALCASHAAPERLRRALASVSRRRTEPVIVSIHQVQPGVVGVGAGGELADDGLGGPPSCVWQKNILMGGKCQLPEFSGVINYDAAGNIVAPSGRPRAAVPAALGW